MRQPASQVDDMLLWRSSMLLPRIASIVFLHRTRVSLQLQ